MNLKAHKVVPYIFYPCLIRVMKLYAIYSILYISLHNIFRAKENIMSHIFVGLLLNSFSDIIFELQKYYITLTSLVIMSP